MAEFTFTVFTPAYNRGTTLGRVYDALKRQSFRDFEWIIVDDGSTDNTSEVVKPFLEAENDFPVLYFYQENRGKHAATNFAVTKARGRFFITLDSDDACTDDALEVFVNEWNKIPAGEQASFKGISCRTCNEHGKLNGKPLDGEYLDSNDLDLRFRHKIDGELWGMTKTEILRDNPYPEIKGLHFYPENILWDNIGRKYKTRYINNPLRIYINDQDNAITNKSTAAHKETIYMRRHFINECWDYFSCDPKFFFKQILGLSRDGALCGMKYGEIAAVPDKTSKKLLVTLTYPFGKLLAKK